MHLHMTDNVRLLGLASIQFEPDSTRSAQEVFSTASSGQPVDVEAYDWPGKRGAQMAGEATATVRFDCVLRERVNPWT